MRVLSNPFAFPPYHFERADVERQLSKKLALGWYPTWIDTTRLVRLARAEGIDVSSIEPLAEMELRDERRMT